MYTPNRGDLIWVDFDPTLVHEQAGHRPAVVLTKRAFNARTKMALLVPVTSRVRGHQFEVKISEASVQGVALCHQARTIDFVSRKIKLADTLPVHTVDIILAKVAALLD
ncbi:MAG: mRNA-degrading endonuclease [Gammaproteobacteria bacterium]|nr:MAG: mRNA-degrading endonuclease [Gammaproteobacteria bacterium]